MDWEGHLWLGGWSRLAKFDLDNHEFATMDDSVLHATNIQSLTIDVYENIWVGTSSKGLLKFDGEKWQVYNTSTSGIASNTIHSLEMDGQGNKWIGTDKGLLKFDGKSRWTIHDRLNSGLPSDTVYAVKVARDGSLWIGTRAGGLAHLKGTRWTVYNPSNSGLPSATVYAIAIDEENCIWVGTQSFSSGRQSYVGGLAKFDRRDWTVYRFATSGLPSNQVFSVAIDRQGNKWIACHKGFAAYREGGVHFSSEPNYDFAVKQNFPNPFNSATRINFSLDEPGLVEIKIYNVLGQYIKTLLSQYKERGEYSVLWTGKDDKNRMVSSGIYFCRVKVGQQITIRKMLMSR